MPAIGRAASTASATQRHPARPATGGRPTRPPAWRARGAKVPTDPQLQKTVAQFEKLGGKGQWFSSTDPFIVNPRQQAFYLITAMPPRAAANADLLLLRDESSKKLLDGMVKSGTPVVLGTLPLVTQVTAAALGNEVPLGAAALARGKITNHSSVMLLQPGASKFTVAHEYQHWKDFENPSLEKNFATDMKPFLTARYLSDDDKSAIWHLMWEVRGHGAQADQALRDARAGLPYTDRAGNISKGPPRALAADYDFEAGDARNIFAQAYQMDIIALLNKIRQHDPEGPKAFAAVMSKYDFSKDPANPVTFRKAAGSAVR